MALETIATILKEVGKISETAIKELPKDKIENIKSAGDGVLAKLDDIKNLTPEQLKMQAEENITKKQTEDNSDANESINIKELTDEEKRKIKKETGWSDEIINRINSMEQYEIYKNAGLVEADINGRKVLIKKDIDLDYKDPKTGETNRERMEKGRSPIDSKTGEKIELHHMGQEFDSPFAVLLENSEHGDGNHKTLHPKDKDSFRNDKEKEIEYNKQKAEHWKTRLNQLEKINKEI